MGTGVKARGGGDGRRALPSVDRLVREAQAMGLTEGIPRAAAVELARRAVARLREGPPTAGQEGGTWEAAIRLLGELAGAYRRRRLVGVVNATGVILHTNLGRAVLPEPAVQALVRAARGYCNLELDLDSGRRGRRESRLEELLTLATGAEAALAVNNNAAAVLLVLSATCSGREVIVSRGELIEIGGEFRLPDVMAQSGCALVEVGTTNRTRLKDYEAAITPKTAAIMKVHTSNYRIVGFSESVEVIELAELAHRHGLLMLEDLGSGCLVDTTRYGMAREPTVQEALRAGADAVMFSGDKLLGGPQAGLVVGRRAIVEAASRHPLARALRVDKLTVAAMEALLALYVEGRHEEIPVWSMIGADPARLAERARRLVEQVEARAGSQAAGYVLEVVPSRATVGGGSLPGEVLDSWAVRVVPRPGSGYEEAAPASTRELADRLRRSTPPVVARLEEDALLIDLRTVLAEEDELVAGALSRALTAPGAAG